ncbi:hypothetical protein HH308_20905 [Gordonia sp. TBRC 11910]|uniref:FIST N domain protein n=1 Tax=Gordonia asplenii TaxID=2725283 RepID=A0A848KZ68_9ACTN|nr:FIST N-terminal domain-containing protein [Gordonia asplenii]NMO03679.1 hypothetical protein [Gordonia asplenii]
MTDQVVAGIGASVDSDSFSAGVAAGSAAIAALSGRPAALVVVYASATIDPHQLLAGVRSRSGAAQVVGATSSGQFHRGEMTAPGAGVTVVALSAGPYRFGVASVTDIDADTFESGRALARNARRAVGEPRRPDAAFVLLSDGLSADQATLLAGVHHVAGSTVPVVGGCAADDRNMAQTLVFHNDSVLANGAVGMWIDSPRPLRVVVAHGWQPVGSPMLVTRSDGTTVTEIDGEPALEVLARLLPERPITETLRYGPGGNPPRSQAIGVIEPGGGTAIRGIYLDDADRIRTFSPLPPYSAIQVVTASADELLGVVAQVAHDALADRPDAGVILSFSCVARLDVLGDDGAAECRLFQEAARDVPTAGFYTYGEFARTHSVAGYHNATLVALAL